MAREVRKFWLKINKVIAFRQKGEADDVRQKVSKSIVPCIESIECFTGGKNASTLPQSEKCSLKYHLLFRIFLIFRIFRIFHSAKFSFIRLWTSILFSL